MPVIRSGPFTLDYAEAGSGEPVLLIHSTASGNRMWRRLTELLANRFEVLAPNLFGCGQTSPWPGDRPLHTAVHAELLAALVPPGAQRVHLVGHSYGGYVAMRMAERLAPRVASLVLLEPNPFGLLAQYGRHAAHAETRAIRDLVKTYGAQGDWERVADGFLDYWVGPGAWAAMPPERRAAFLAMIPSNFHEWDAFGEEIDLERYRPLAGRTLVVTARDTVRAMREIAAVLSEQLPALTHVELPGGGHMAPLTHPQDVNPVVEAFLTRR